MSEAPPTASPSHQPPPANPSPHSSSSTPPMQFKQIALSLLHKLQHGLSPQRIELVYTSHSRWPIPHSAPSSPAPEPRKNLTISILDSSFNPPTRAHLALANAPHPALTPRGNEESYDATLLLLSVRNADKSLSPGDATYLQRLEMMCILTNDVRQAQGNSAIAIIDEPTFAGKETVLKSFLESRLAEGGWARSVSLTFLLGMDTLERLFAPRYYGSAGKMMESLGRFFEGARVVCARRRLGTSTSSSTSTTVPASEAIKTPPSEGLPTGTPADEEPEALKLARPFISTGRIQLIDIGEREAGFSSSAIRADIRKYGYGAEGTEEVRGDEGWRDWVTDDVARYVVQEELYLPRVDSA